jgi:Protein of unknown function (DUF3617)
MVKMKVAAASVALAFAVANAQELPKRKPGLWEAQISTSGSNMPNMQDRLANMPPEQRAQMEAYMKQRGMSFDAGSNTQTVRFCLTSQQVAEEGNKTFISRFQRNAERGSRCEEKVLAHTSSEVRFHAVCHPEDGGVSELDGHIYDLSPESVALELKGKSTQRGEFQMQQKAHWLASDCGNVK